MNGHSGADAGQRFLHKDRFPCLLEQLEAMGYSVIGPTLDQHAIVYDRIRSVDDLPRGWTDEQQPGSYRVRRRTDDAWFGYVVGPHSWKGYLFPTPVVIARAAREGGDWEFKEADDAPPKFAFLGVRACEIAAIRVQDRVFLAESYVDPIYEGRRTRALIVAVNCEQAASTCFCPSMGTGPRCTSGFDLALTELSDGFVVEVGTAEGAALLATLDSSEASISQLRAAQAARRSASEQIERSLDTRGLRDLLMDNLEHPRWDETASRCLSCANCTMVCPTCFCGSVEEVSDLAGGRVERRRRWDSCFNIDFSYMNGGHVRDSIRSRYRQWLTHKLASWNDQFGTSGCVGCGRCITWCPSGIDLTEEVLAIRGDAPVSEGSS
ncbi:MAG: sulfite reductase subunit A [Planctomycetes bacterium]|nr:sulfite reductase subunit A [Planctomycetota bacterium]